jgi:hypothetical protein
MYHSINPLALTPRLILALAAAAACGTAIADPYSFGASLSYRNYPNLYNAVDGAAKTSDSVVAGTLFAGLSQPLGRQRLYANTSVSSNRYMKTDNLNNVSYNLSGGLDWSTIERVSGNVFAGVTQSLQDFGLDANQVSAPEKNQYRTQNMGATVRVGVVTKITAEANYTRNKVSYSLASYANRETSQDTVGASLRYAPSTPLNFGIGLRRTNGDVPGLGDSFTRNDLDLFANYTVAAAHTFTSRLSWSKSKYDDLTARNLDGVTASIYWNWAITPKTTFSTSYSRDTGLDTSFLVFNNQQVPLQFDNSRVANVLSARLNYQVTSKVNTYVDGRFSQRKTINRVANIDQPGSEDQRNLAIGVGWTPTRAIGLGCDIGSLSRDIRSTTTGNAPTTVSRTQSAMNYGCSAQITFQ